ncbi:hypothetical protein [Laspinema sp. D2d]|nr:hypothetical protein [Laspinema sp. D2d]
MTVTPDWINIAYVTAFCHRFAYSWVKFRALGPQELSGDFLD